MGPCDNHKLHIANRGEIAVSNVHHQNGDAPWASYRRNLYAPPMHPVLPILLAHEAALLPVSASEAAAYLAAARMVAICREGGATLVHPGYGFLAENTTLRKAALDVGVAMFQARRASPRARKRR